MHKILFFIAIFSVVTGLTQTAVNFTCNDCAGYSHDLFTELDAGKVIVICWVEPCGGCADPSLISAYIVESYQNNFPEKVFMYLVDDYADTDCTSLISWANMFGIHPSAFFSDEAINMLDYGPPGMPKVVVAGGINHEIFYNANNLVDSTALSQAIYEAIVATSTEINQFDNESDMFTIYPNPSANKVFILLDQEFPGNIFVQISSQTGDILYQKSWNGRSIGLNRLEIDIHDFKNGLYLIEIIDGKNYSSKKMIIQH